MVMDKQTVQIKELLDQITRAVGSEIQEKSLDLKIEIDEKMPESIVIDKIKLIQAISNFLQQSILRTDQGPIILRAESPNGDTCFCVEDAGRQLDTEQIQKMLNAQVSAASWMQQDELREIGLPLRMGSKLVRMLGGRIDLKSSPEKTTFSLIFNAAGNTEAEGSESSVTDSANEMDSKKAAEPTVLLVDDVDENRALLGVLLRKLGYRCVHCGNGEEAVKTCKEQKFEIIMMDIQMPRMDGFQASRVIRQNGLNQKTPILAMTASGQKGDDLKALDAGCNDCLGKPISREKLEKKIWRLTAQARQLQDAQDGREIISFLEGDPDYKKAVETFVSNLPEKIDGMKDAFEKRDLKDLAFKAHALKGLGGFAGFPVFTEKAKDLEDKLQTEDLDQIRTQLDELIQLCLRTKLKNPK